MEPFRRGILSLELEALLRIVGGWCVIDWKLLRWWVLVFWLKNVGTLSRHVGFLRLVGCIRIYVVALLVLMGAIKLWSFLHSALQSASIVTFISILCIRLRNCPLIISWKLMISRSCTSLLLLFCNCCFGASGIGLFIILAFPFYYYSSDGYVRCRPY